MKVKLRSLLSFLMILCIIISLVPTSTAFAANVVNSVSLTIIEPEGKVNPDHYPTLPYGENYTQVNTYVEGNYIIKGVMWINVDDNCVISSADDFVEGKTYRITVFLMTKAGYTFSDSVTGKVNGKSAVIHHNIAAHIKELFPDRDMITVSQEFVAKPHTHGIAKLSGYAPTCKSSGVKPYYYCICGTYFEDEAGTKVIPDFDAWKLGEGKLDPAHSFNTYAWEYKLVGGHAHKCSSCDACGTLVPHVDSNAKDGKCDVCGWNMNTTYDFVSQPQTVFAEEETDVCNVYWETNFVPVKTEMFCGDSVFAWSEGRTDTKDFTPISVSHYSSFYVRAYYGSGAGDFVDSQRFQVRAKGMYVIRLEANGGESVTWPVTGQDGKIASLPVITNGNMVFDGWYTALAGGEKVTTDTVFTEDSTIYARWKNPDGFILDSVDYINCTINGNVVYVDDKADYKLVYFDGEKFVPVIPENDGSGTVFFRIPEGVGRVTLVVNGEVNGDESVDALDAALLLKLDASLATLDAKGLISGDVNNDGYVDALDAAMILKYDAGIIEKL